MRLLLFFEGVFFSCFYSLPPFFVSDLMTKSVHPYRNFETEETRDLRYITVSCIAFCLFYYYSISGLRNRYVTWHLARRRYASGFSPLETAAVAMYHSVALCLLSESILPFFDKRKPIVLTSIWLEHLGSRMKNVFFLSILQHTALELSGFFDKIRREYFHVARPRG
jgi:hypothetical protein